MTSTPWHQVCSPPPTDAGQRPPRRFHTLKPHGHSPQGWAHLPAGRSNEVIFLRSNVMEPVKICSEAATVDGLAPYN